MLSSNRSLKTWTYLSISTLSIAGFNYCLAISDIKNTRFTSALQMWRATVATPSSACGALYSIMVETTGRAAIQQCCIPPRGRCHPLLFRPTVNPPKGFSFSITAQPEMFACKWCVILCVVCSFKPLSLSLSHSRALSSNLEFYHHF